MKWIKASDRIPNDDGNRPVKVNGQYAHGNFFDLDEDKRAFSVNSSCDGYIVYPEYFDKLEWLDENDTSDIDELNRRAAIINQINFELTKENENYKNYTLKAIGYKERIIELESAFAGSEEMIKDKIKKISELEKAILLLTEVVDEQQQRLNNYDL